jgi:hypothetical protein
MTDTRSTHLLASAAAVAVALAATSASAQVVPPNPPFVSYAAKFVCGVQKTDADVVRGVYASTINLHNPQAQLPVRFFKKAVIALPERSDVSGPIAPGVFDTLKPDQAMGVDCTDIRSLFPPPIVLPPHIEGFVVIEVIAPTGTQNFPLLDVVGKYTVRHENTAAADKTISDANGIDVVPVTGKLITQ